MILKSVRTCISCKNTIKTVMTSQRTFCRSAQERNTVINGQTINYLITGGGSKTVLCFPGALGTIWSDFKPQITDLDRTKFTVVAWDPPGYGYSRPPRRHFDAKFYENDADVAHAFMKSIGFNKFSLLGWSDGGISSMILAAKYPAVVDKLVVWGANAYIIPEEIESYESEAFFIIPLNYSKKKSDIWQTFFTINVGKKDLPAQSMPSELRDISKWSDKMKAPLVKLYTEEGLQKMWSNWCDAVAEMYSKNNGNICKEILGEIKCPTLILHGDKDPMVAAEHPAFLASHIPGAVLRRFPEGKHNIHLRFAQEFNEIVSNFLSRSGS